MNIDRYRKLLRMERDSGASQGERDNARRLRTKMEHAHPSIRVAAAQAAAREAPRTDTEPMPGPYETGSYGPPRPTRPEPTPIDRLRSFFQAAVDEVGASFTLQDMVRQDIELDVRANTRTIHLHIRIPLEGLDRAEAFTGGSLEEYSRLIGVRVGSFLSRFLREDAY